MLKKRIRDFWRDRRGYVIALTLIAMPMLLGFSLLIIDASRGDNLHTDLQDAVDALALAGARQLDGRNDAIARAETAMAQLANSATFGANGASNSLGGSVQVSYVAGTPSNGCDYSSSTSTVHVLFLASIPSNDDDKAWRQDNIQAFCNTYGATGSSAANDASYVRVIAKPQAMKTIFPVPVGFSRDTVDIGAEATAVYNASACDITPIFICNPFEPADNTSQAVAQQADEALHTNFANGNLYGVQIELHNNSSNTPGPGNFGFLNTYGNGANVLSNALATGSPGVCYKQTTLESKTGATTGPVAAGLNTRFGIYESNFGSNSGDANYRPANNVRMAQDQKNKVCSSYNPVTSTDATGATIIGDTSQAVPLGFGAKMASIGTGSGEISRDPATGDLSNNWDYQTYWRVAQNEDLSTGSVPSTATILANASSYPPTAPATGPSQPSAYDVYRYEIAHPTGATAPKYMTTASADGETGVPKTGGQCYTGPALSNYQNTDKYGDRRLIFTAIVNCGYQGSLGNLNGGSGTFPAVAFASVFLTKPAIKNAGNGDRYISMELVDITGKGGLGKLDTFLREESELVR